MARLGSRILFQIALAIGGGEHLPTAAARHAAVPAATSPASRCRSPLPGVGVPMARRMARGVANRDTRYRAAVASHGLESLLAVAFQTEKKDRLPDALPISTISSRIRRRRPTLSQRAFELGFRIPRGLRGTS